MNIFFILTDSICNFEREDEKSILPVYKELIEKREGFYFNNCVSLFPSTIMSIMSIFTGKFPYYIMPDFYNSLGDYKLKTYFDEFKKNNYEIKSIICWNLGASLLKNILNPIVKQDWYKADRQLEAKEIYNIFKKEIKNINNEKNNFFYVHFRAGDKEMNKYTEKIIKLLKKEGFWEKDFIIITSDHGYYYKKINKKIKLLHFDDISQSSLTPATFIKIPKKYTKSEYKTINKRIYTIDILETILDYLNIKTTNYRKDAKSFKRVIEEDKDINKNRIIRADAYLKFQPVKKTAIIKDNWKLKIDKGKTELIKITKGIYEQKKDPKKNRKIFEELHQFYLKTEEKASREIEPILNSFFKDSHLSKIKGEKIFIPEKQYPREVVKYLKRKLSEKNEIINEPKKGEKTKTIILFNRLTGYGIKKLRKKYQKNTKNFIIINIQFKKITAEEKKSIGYFNFIKKSLKERYKVILQRPFDILLWVFYMPLYFNKYLKKDYK